MSFPPRFLDEIRGRVSLVEVISKSVKLTRKGREYLGLCPFHKEKTPSFTVNEEKGFYHCFGCGAHGSIFDFEMKTGNLSFIEAVEKLASMAGLEMPVVTPEEAMQAKKQKNLYEVLDRACSFYEKQLRSPVGRYAVEYLKSRGLDENTVSRFRIGYAPSGNVLRAALANEDIDIETMAAAGLVTVPDDDRSPYDYFRDRILFPITDRKGRVIAFGGRIMGEGQPKYLNSPETSVFSKGYVLYGLAQASRTAFDKKEIIVTEGYMDVISLSAAGFENCVAPLGTALTEAQIRELWKMAPEPYLCFDGDSAGQRAGQRAAERALPLLKAGFSMRFITLPEGKDPDDVIRSEGNRAFKNMISSAVSMAEFIWNRLISGRNIETPERRAALEKDINDIVSNISDNTVQQYYRRDLKNRLWQLMSSGRKSYKGSRKTYKEPFIAPSFPEKDEGKKLLAYVIRFPEASGRWIEDFSAISFNNPEYRRLLDFIVDELSSNPAHSFESLKEVLEANGFDKLLVNLKTHMTVAGRKAKDSYDLEKELQVLVTGMQESKIDDEIEKLLKAMDAENNEENYKKMWEQLKVLKQEKMRLKESHEGHV